jgi:hypothetical protein
MIKSDIVLKNAVGAQELLGVSYIIPGFKMHKNVIKIEILNNHFGVISINDDNKIAINIIEGIKYLPGGHQPPDESKKLNTVTR